MATGLLSTVATGFVSKIFKSPQTKDGFSKFIQVYSQAIQEKGKNAYPIFLLKFMNRQPMTAKEKRECTSWVLERTRNWTKAQKKGLIEELSNIQVISEPKVPSVTTHKVSSSFNTELLKEGIKTTKDPQELTIQPKATKQILTLVLIATIGLVLIPKLMKRG